MTTIPPSSAVISTPPTRHSSTTYRRKTMCAMPTAVHVPVCPNLPNWVVLWTYSEIPLSPSKRHNTFLPAKPSTLQSNRSQNNSNLGILFQFFVTCALPPTTLIPPLTLHASSPNTYTRLTTFLTSLHLRRLWHTLISLPVSPILQVSVRISSFTSSFGGGASGPTPFPHHPPVLVFMHTKFYSLQSSIIEADSASSTT